VPVVALQQFLPLRIAEWQHLRKPVADPGRVVETASFGLRVRTAETLDQPLQQCREQAVLGLDLRRRRLGTELDFGHDQSIVAHPRAQHVETAFAAHLQTEQAVVADVEVDDARARAERGRRRGRADFGAVEDQADPEATLAARALLDHVKVARLEHAQAQVAAGKQYGAQREQRQFGPGHAASVGARRGPGKPALIGPRPASRRSGAARRRIRRWT
jgi:hypothetical protein